MNKKFLIGFVLVFFLMSFASAGILDGKNKHTSKIDFKLDKKTIQYNKLWEKYNPIEIKPLFGKTKWKGAIVEHTEVCEDNCFSTMEIYLVEEGSLIDGVTFYTINGEDKYEQPIRSYEFEYYNGTDWVGYNEGEVLPKGEYTLKLLGEKKPSRTVDWIIETQGKIIDEWAVWESVWLINGELNYNTLTSSVWNNTGDNGLNPFDYNNNTYSQTYFGEGGASSARTDYLGKIFSAINVSNIKIKASLASTMTGTESMTLQSYDGASWNDEAILLSSVGTYDNIYTLNKEIQGLRIEFKTPTPSAPAGSWDAKLYTLEYRTVGVANVTLNSPADNSISDTNLVTFNATTNIVAGAYITNMSLWTNKSGTWEKSSSIDFTSNNYFIDIYAATSPNFNANNVNTTKIANNVWRINSTEADYNTSRAKVIESLFYGTAASYDPEILKFGTITRIISSDTRDNNSMAHFGRITNGRYGGTMTYTFDDNEDTYLSSWVRLSASSSGNLAYSVWKVNGTEKRRAQSSGGTITNITMGTVLSDEFSNAHTLLLWTEGPNVGTSNDANVIFLTDSNLSIVYGDAGSKTNVSFTEDHSIPIIELYGTSLTQTINDTITNDIIWNIQSCDSDGDCGFAPSNYTLFLDTEAPTFSVASPTGTTPYWTAGDNEWLNTTITDTNLDTCWYNYNGTNQTFSCSTGVEATNEFPVQIYNYNMTIYANDSLGNQNSSFISWNVPFFISTETYDSSILEGGTGAFSLTGETNGTAFAIANLSYDSSGNIGTITTDGNAFIINKSISVPLVTADTNNTFFWKLTQGSATTSLTSYNQTVVNFGIDDCSVNTNVLYNFTIKDEKTQVKLVPGTQNTSAKIDLSVYSALDGSTIGGLNTSYSKLNSFSVCLSSDLSAGETYKVDLQAEYGADDYATEFYNIQKSTITSSTLNQNISLYSLDNTTSQIFEIIYRDSSYLPVEGALLTLQRKYIDEGVFKTVEAPVTDSNGQTLVNLELYNAVYTFVFSKDGTVLSTFNKKRVKCDNLVLGQCDYTFNAASSPVLPTSYTIIDGISYVLSYDNDTRVVSNTFTIQDGTVKTVSVNVSLMDSVNSFVCSNQLTSSSGTVSCTVPTKFNNGTAMVKVYQDGVWEGQAQIFLGTNNKDLYGKNIVFLSIFMLLTLFGVGISGNPVVTAIFLFIGAIVGIGMNITGASGVIGAGATVLWLLIAIVLVIIKGSKRD